MDDIIQPFPNNCLIVQKYMIGSQEPGILYSGSLLGHGPASTNELVSDTLRGILLQPEVLTQPISLSYN